MNCTLCIWYLLSRRVVEGREAGGGDPHDLNAKHQLSTSMGQIKYENQRVVNHC